MTRRQKQSKRTEMWTQVNTKLSNKTGEVFTCQKIKKLQKQ